MPDIGLLGGPPRPRIVPPPVLPAALGEVALAIGAAHFVAPVAATPIAVVSIALTEVAPAKSAAIDTVQAAMETSSTAAAPAVAAAAEVPADVSAPTLPRAPQPLTAPPPIRWSDLLWLALALLIIIGTGVGIRDPWPADEPRFAAVARDMVVSGEWLFPRVGGDLYQDKPPLFFWLLAVCYSLLGSLRWSFLLPAFCAAGGVLFLVYDFGRRLVSREAGLACALITCFTLQFLMVFRGAQIDPVLGFLTTLSLYALLRHMLLGPAWGWYCIGGFVAGIGVFTKGVGFLPLLLLIPFFALRGFKWQGLASIDAGRGGWRWWLAPLAMLAAICLWFVPMLLAVASNGTPEYIAYRDEILFKQTVGRYAASWHHVKAWYYFIVEVVPPLWLPWSLLLFWLVPRFKAAWRERDARVWLPLSWVFIVLLFFSLSPGKRGVYITPALPALAIASLPFIEELFARGRRLPGSVLAAAFKVIAVLAIAYFAQAKSVLAAVNSIEYADKFFKCVFIGASITSLYFLDQLLKRSGVRRVGFALASGFWLAAFVFVVAQAIHAEFALEALKAANLASPTPFYVYLAVCGVGLIYAFMRAPLVAWPVAIGTLAIVFSYLIAPAMNGERSARDFVHAVLRQVPANEDLAFVAYKEQFLLYLDRPIVNFGHRRVFEGPQESYDSSAWLNEAANRILLVPADQLKPCFAGNAVKAGSSSDEDWFLVRAPAASACAQKGDSRRAIRYDVTERK